MTLTLKNIVFDTFNERKDFISAGLMQGLMDIVNRLTDIQKGETQNKTNNTVMIYMCAA